MWNQPKEEVVRVLKAALVLVDANEYICWALAHTVQGYSPTVERLQKLVTDRLGGEGQCYGTWNWHQLEREGRLDRPTTYAEDMKGRHIWLAAIINAAENDLPFPAPQPYSEAR